MTNNELIAVLRLQRTPKIGTITAKKLINHCGSPTAIFSDKVNHLKKIEGIGPLLIEELFRVEHLKAAEKEFEYISKNSIAYYYYKDPEYPKYLMHCLDGPLLLFKRGKIELADRKIISVVGTRNITSYGAAFCEQFIADIAPLNPVIVSGYAFGVDICVQRAARNSNLQTIGCLAHGLNQIYPKEHSRYASAMEENGGFLTEFWSTSHPERENFLRRNRIIAGISEATVVVESAERGGSLVTADIANSYNRDVFAVPGRVNDQFSLGCNNLIKQQKAHLLSSAADLVYLLNWSLKEPKFRPVQKRLFPDLNDTEKKVFHYLQKAGIQRLDDIALACALPIYQTSSTLLNMEMKGVIRPRPGKLFEIA